jgi:hypothetical protein
MRHPLLVAVCLCAIPAAGPARAQVNWSLGANLGYEASRPVEPGPRHLSQVGWPNFRPAPRIGRTQLGAGAGARSRSRSASGSDYGSRWPRGTECCAARYATTGTTMARLKDSQ